MPPKNIEFNRDDYDMTDYDAALAEMKARPKFKPKPKGPPYEFAVELMLERQQAEKEEMEGKQQEEKVPKKSKYNRDDYDMTDYDAALAEMKARPKPKPKGPPYEEARRLMLERQHAEEEKEKKGKTQQVKTTTGTMIEGQQKERSKGSEENQEVGLEVCVELMKERTSCPWDLLDFTLVGSEVA
ncbi:hypothetical protein BDZ45DRAFT_686678 [Acephala macrosclerotiorum]|nr:hypothetical protein BDZ45DRAFT_686678 [Acephala macrosclerotiorum]